MMKDLFANLTGIKGDWELYEATPPPKLKRGNVVLDTDYQDGGPYVNTNNSSPRKCIL
jgi:hypothetical protein